MAVDNSGAYLNAFMKSKMARMRIPPDIAIIICEEYTEFKQFLQPNGWLYVQLERTLYGCVESAKLWYELLRLAVQLSLILMGGG